MRILKKYQLYFAWLVAMVATLGSLYFSEIKGFVPCELCWFQRILMYPLAIILGIAAFFEDGKVKKYVLPLSILGICVSSFHYLKQKTTWFDTIKPCTQGIPCNTKHFSWFGFITIPFLALIAFLLITLLMILNKEDRNTWKLK